MPVADYDTVVQSEKSRSRISRYAHGRARRVLYDRASSKADRVSLPQLPPPYRYIFILHFYILTVGSNLGRGRESRTSRLPKSSLETYGLLVTGFPSTGRIFGSQTDVPYPRPGSFGSHGHRIDFCESAVFNHFVI